jgi:hypothetical protein
LADDVGLRRARIERSESMLHIDPDVGEVIGQREHYCFHLPTTERLHRGPVPVPIIKY